MQKWLSRNCKSVAAEPCSCQMPDLQWQAEGSWLWVWQTMGPCTAADRTSNRSMSSRTGRSHRIALLGRTVRRAVVLHTTGKTGPQQSSDARPQLKVHLSSNVFSCMLRCNAGEWSRLASSCPARFTSSCCKSTVARLAVHQSL